MHNVSSCSTLRVSLRDERHPSIKPALPSSCWDVTEAEWMVQSCSLIPNKKHIFHVHFLYFHCAEDRLGPLVPCRKHCLPPLTGSVLVLLFSSTSSPSFLPSLALSLWFVFCDNSRDWSRHWMKKKNIICMKHSLIRPGVPLNCVVLHMVGLSGLILWILLIPCNLTNSLQFPPRLASPRPPVLPPAAARWMATCRPSSAKLRALESLECFWAPQLYQKERHKSCRDVTSLYDLFFVATVVSSCVAIYTFSLRPSAL